MCVCVWRLQSELVSELAQREESVVNLKRQLTETQERAEVGWCVEATVPGVHGEGAHTVWVVGNVGLL